MNSPERPSSRPGLGADGQDEFLRWRTRRRILTLKELPEQPEPPASISVVKEISGEAADGHGGGVHTRLSGSIAIDVHRPTADGETGVLKRGVGTRLGECGGGRMEGDVGGTRSHGERLRRREISRERYAPGTPMEMGSRPVARSGDGAATTAQTLELRIRNVEFPTVGRKLRCRRRAARFLSSS